MSSAQVFPMAISEFRRLVSRPNNNNNNSVERVRRNLFGPVDREEIRALADRELAAIARLEMEKWSFNFVKEEPVNNPEAKYVWERIVPEESIPEAYALKRFQYLGVVTNSSTVSTMPASETVSTTERTKAQHQKQITDYFLAARKRPSFGFKRIGRDRKSATKSKSIISPLSSHSGKKARLTSTKQS